MAQPQPWYSIKGKIRPSLKIAGLAILAAIVIYVVFVFIGSLITSLRGGGLPKIGYDPGYSEKYASSEMGIAPTVTSVMKNASNMVMPMLSQRNAESDDAYYSGGGSTGNEAENFEMRQYSAQIENNRSADTCAAVAGLKSRADVIFENASEYRRGCSYSFKVAREKTDEILTFIKNLKPKQVVSNTYTIQKQVQDYTSKIDILQKKLAVIEDTLNGAMTAYDEVAALATDTKDAESLARVISNKISTIKQLTQERLSVSSELDNIGRAKEQQLDRLNYTYFNVSVSDNSFVDAQSIGDSWNLAMRMAINQINGAIQNISVNLVVLAFGIVQYFIYGVILLIVVKYGWRLGKRIWQK